jgi:site-specific recombinase XerD
MASLQLPEALPSWCRSLKASNKSEKTIASYFLAANQLIEYLGANRLPLAVDQIDADTIRGFLEDVLSKRASATARQRYASLGQLFKWLYEEGEIDRNPMDRVHPPKVSEQPVPVLLDDELRKLIGAPVVACSPTFTATLVSCWDGPPTKPKRWTERLAPETTMCCVTGISTHTLLPIA